MTGQDDRIGDGDHRRFDEWQLECYAPLCLRLSWPIVGVAVTCSRHRCEI